MNVIKMNFSRKTFFLIYIFEKSISAMKEKMASSLRATIFLISNLVTGYPTETISF